jgi:hypothetical protein
MRAGIIASQGSAQAQEAAMCYEYWRFGRKETAEERARREADAVIEKARSEAKPKPKTPAAEQPVTAEEPASG